MQETVFLKQGEYGKLVKAIKMHDLEGFSTLYDACSPILYGYIKKSLYQQKASEEVLQECFCAMWKTAEDMNPCHQGIFTWSFKIVRKEVSKKKVELLLNEIFACQRQPVHDEVFIG